MSTDPTPYDTFAYRGFAYMETHPLRLSALAALYGMTPAPGTRCRVLELGCGVGANLIPMAVQYPDSEFVGLDLSGRSIEIGSDAAAALGLKNISLRHVDIMNVGADYGLFDYIVAHGVYSWVPVAVRDRMLAVYHDNLSPQGVAYVSYNAHPGSHLRELVRDMMLFHVRDMDDPRQRVGQARAIIKALAEASPETSAHGMALRDQFKRIESMGDDILYHDDLDEVAAPFLLHQVVADAEHHGLQYLCDSSLWRRSLDRVAEPLRSALAQFNSSAYMARDQYHDFIDGHGFRRTLLCHGDVRLDRDVTPATIKRFHFAFGGTPVSPDIDPAADVPAEFKSRLGDTLEVKHPLSKAALLHLDACWPAALSFDELVGAARARLGPQAASEAQVDAMAAVLLELVYGGHVEFFAFAPPWTGAISQRPQASLLARRQAEGGSTVTSLRHNSVMLEGEAIGKFVQLVDGTRDIDQLVVDFAEVARTSGKGDDLVTRATVEHNLQMLAKLALLVG